MIHTLDLFQKRKQVNIDNILGDFGLSLGRTGSGKTNANAVILEEMIKKNVGFTVVDMEGEYWGLREKYEVLILGNSKRSTVKVHEDHFIDTAKQFAHNVLSQNLPVILDVSEWEDDKMEIGLDIYFRTLFELEQNLMRQHLILIEEAQEFIPQGANTLIKPTMIKISKRGRKRALSTIFSSQRVPDIDKKLTSQAGFQFFGRVTDPIDIKKYSEYLPYSARQLTDEYNIADFKAGEFFVKLPQTKPFKTRFRKRDTFHASDTPKYGEQSIKIPVMKEVSEEIIKAFSKIARSERKKKDTIELLQAQVVRGEAKYGILEKEFNKLQQRYEIASSLTITMPKSFDMTVKNAVFEALQINNILPIPFDDDVKYNEKTNNTSRKEFIDPIIKHIKRIKQRVNRANQSEFKIMDFLITREKNEYTTSQLNSWMGWRTGRLSNNPPKYMLDIGWIYRQNPHRQEMIWKSSLKSFVESEFSVYMNEEYQVITEIYENIGNWVHNQAEDITRSH